MFNFLGCPSVYIMCGDCDQSVKIRATKMLGCKAFKIFVKDKKSNSCPFQAKYKDPRTGIQYNNSMEFGSIRSLPMDIVSGYLTLRKAAAT